MNHDYEALKRLANKLEDRNRGLQNELAATKSELNMLRIKAHIAKASETNRIQKAFNIFKAYSQSEATFILEVMETARQKPDATLGDCCWLVLEANGMEEC